MRRYLTIPAVLLVTALLTITLPVWLVLAALLSLIPAIRGTLRFGLFLTLYAWCETFGIIRAGLLWLRFRGGGEPGTTRHARYLEANFALQCWWGQTLKNGTQAIFGLRFEFDNLAALDGPPPIWILRHASMGDTVVPLAFYSAPRRIRLRYVLKRELLLDPCLDIVGNRLPNYFVDRASDTPREEVTRVAALIEGLGPEEGVLIYPEGTRFSEPKRRRLVASLQQRDPALAERAAAWPNLLPPRLGGPLALLQNNPGRDLLFVAHTGFEGSSHFQSLINGSWAGSVVRVRLWRVPFDAIPTDPTGSRAFLLDQWDRMAREVAALSGAAAPTSTPPPIV